MSSSLLADSELKVADYTMIPDTARMADIPRVCLQVTYRLDLL